MKYIWNNLKYIREGKKRKNTNKESIKENQVLNIILEHDIIL